MAVDTEKYHRLLNYLDGRLPPDEEESFAKELSADVELQKQFDFELMLRAGTGAQNEAAVAEEFEPAETHWQKAKAIIENTPPVMGPANESAKVVSIQRRNPLLRMTAIAALILVVGSLLVFYLNRKEPPPVAGQIPTQDKGNPLVKNDTGTSQKSQSPNEGPTLPAPVQKPPTGPGLYAKHFSRYQANADVPGPVREYYGAYFYDKDYPKVWAATDADLAVSGAGDNQPTLHLLFYKALCWLESGKADNAVVQLNALLAQTRSAEGLHAPVRWYLALAYLKDGDVAAAKKTAQGLAVEKGSSPYKAQAVRLLKEID